MHTKRDRLQVQQDVDHVLLYTLDAGVFMEHAVDLDLGDGATGHRRKQHTTKRVAERVAEAPLERFNDDARLARGNGLHLHDAGLQELGNGSLHCGYTLPVSTTGDTNEHPIKTNKRLEN